MRSNSQSYRRHLRTDLLAGLVVFLVALPLGLGIALASGAPLFSGIIASIIGGLIVGLLSGSQVNVTGPAASVALIVLAGIETLGSFEAVLVAVVLAGVIQILMGYLRLGTIAYFFPNAMIKGILASIGVVLILKQLPHAFGVAEAFKATTSFGQEGGLLGLLSQIERAVSQVQLGPTLLTLLCLALIIAWDSGPLQRYRAFRTFPSTLAAVLVGVVVNALFIALAPELAMRPEQLVQLPEFASPSDFLAFFATPDFDALARTEVYTLALSIAFIASLATLLSTEAADKLDPYKRVTSTNRELKAQGVGNVLSGLVGGLPLTAVIVRTSANIQSGGRMRTATLTHGAIMAVCVIAIPNLLNRIPLPALSAVLFIVGYRLTSLPLYRAVFRQGRRQFLPFILTILAATFSDLVTGILIGGAIALFFILRDNYKNAYLAGKVDTSQPQRTVITLAQETTFLNKADISLFLEHLPDGQHLVIDGREALFIHPDILEIIEAFQESAPLRQITVELLGLDDPEQVTRRRG